MEPTADGGWAAALGRWAPRAGAVAGLAVFALALLSLSAHAAPSIEILAPTEGASQDSATLLISVDVQNMTLNGSAIGQSSVPGEGHYHLYLDNVWLRAEVASNTFLAGISAGPHVLRVELAENNHTEIGFGDEVNFTVLAGAPRVVIVSPGNASSWPSNSAELLLLVEDFTLVAGGGAPVDGEGHYRVLVDGVLQAESATTLFNVTHLAVGRTNVIRVELVSNDGTPLPEPTFDQISLRPAAGAPTLVLDAAIFDASVGSASLRAAFTVTNFTLDGGAISQPPSAGEGHYMVWLDGVALGPGVENPILLSDLAEGGHLLVVELVNNDHTQLTARVVDWASFTVTAGAPRVTVTAPSDPATVNASSLRLAISVAQFTLSAAHIGQANVVGEGHWHMFADGVDVGMGAELETLVSDLAVGPHVLVVELRNNDHSQPAWPAFDTLRVVVLAGAPRLTITSPTTPSVTVASSSVELAVQVQGFALNASAVGLAPRAGEGHWHLFVDGVYEGFGTSTAVLASRLSPGTHHLVVELFNNDHTGLLWPAFDQVTVTVPEGSPTLEILSPSSSFYTPLNFTVMRVAVTNFTVVDKPDQTPQAGEGHWHIFLDGAFYDMAYTPTATLLNLAPGPHTVRAVVVGNDHLFLTPLLADEVTFTVGGAKAAIEITSPQGGTFVYGDSTRLEVATENFTIAPTKVGQPPVAGEGHWHYFLDGVYVTFVAASSYNVTGLLPGEHTILARLYNNDHSPIGILVEHSIVLHVAGAPRITFASPANGFVTSDTSVALSFAVTNFTLDPLSLGTQNQPGHGHYHVIVDGNTSGVKMESDLQTTISGLSEGPHVLKVVLVNRDHSPIGAPGSEAQIIVTVVPAAPPSDGFLLIGLGALAAIIVAVAIAALLIRRRKPAQ